MLFYARWGRPYKYAASLQSPLIQFAHGSDNICVRFWYHIHGRERFNVYNTTGNGTLKSLLWRRQDDVPNGWNNAQIMVPRMPPFKVVIY